MRVVYLTAGAAGMYCGSCMRDNALIAALRAKGRDALLVPLYTPIRTDEPDVSECRVLYGGINVFLQQACALFRYVPHWLDRWLDSPALLRRALRRASTAAPAMLGAMTVSTLEGERGRQRKELRRLVRWLRGARPDVVNLPNAMFVGTAGAIREALGVPVVCTLTGEDIFLDRLPAPYREEAIGLIRRGARDVDAFVAVSRYYASYASDRFAIPAERLHVIPLGVRVGESSERVEPPAEPFTIGYLARICPEKGLHVLSEAFLLLRRAGRPCRLLAAGYLDEAERPYLDGVRARLGSEGRDSAFEYVGELDGPAKRQFLRSLHVLSVPTTYREAKGLYVLEALAQGVPVVQPNHGAFPEMIESTGGGLLVEADDPSALADAIGDLMDDPAQRRQLACRGRAAVLKSFTDDMMAERTWSLYEGLARRLRG